MASWANQRGTAKPAAPVLLRQAALTARGGAGEDFEVSLPGECMSSFPRPSTSRGQPVL